MLNTVESHDRTAEALRALLHHLDAVGYDFVAPTPATHARVVGRKRQAQDLRDVFGWSLPFARGALPEVVFAGLEAAGLLEPHGSALRSRVRVSRLDGRLFVHSAYPTKDKDAVFLGPDSYRFARLIHAHAPRDAKPRLIVDLGAGAGVGGIVAGALRPGARVVLTDLNAGALSLAEVNAAHAGVPVETRCGDACDLGFEGVDLALANPPFMLDPEGRTYRNGGDMHGARLSLDWSLCMAQALAPGGRMILYTGSAIVDGRDELRQALEAQLPALGCTLVYEEIDPDIFGEDLDQPGYEDVERIAAVGAVIDRSA